MSRHLRTSLPEKVKQYTDVTICQEPDEQGSTALAQALSLITVKLSSLLELPADQIDSGEIYKLSNSLSGLVRAGVELSRWQLEKAGALGHARTEFELLLRQQVEKHPTLVKKLQQIIASMDGA